jgi:S1-C subfamily serine protease
MIFSHNPLSFRFSFFWGVGFFVFSFFGLAEIPVVSAEQELPQEALVDLVKPSIVRVAEHVSGTAKVPRVKVDIQKRLVAVIPDSYSEVPVDEYLVGSGFIVHPDGYIATNSHVVSEETVKEMLASDSALAALYENALFLSDIEMQNFLESETENSFSQIVLKYVEQQSIFDLKKEVAVLRPDSEKKSIPELLKEGFPAMMVSLNDNFLEDEKDVALIKINESRLPALTLGVGETMTVGKKSFIFGFPATAELNQNNSLEATFTQGVVSAIKQSADKNFKIYQTDAKVSEGSSGGPLFDETGAVVGIVTFQTDELNRTQGDNFAFALPIEMVRRAAEVAGISPLEGKYSENFKKGFQFFSLKQCDKAGEAFRTAQSESNTVFVGDEDFAPYFKKCAELQKTGMALDTRLDRLKGDVRALGNPFFYLVGIGLLLFGIFGGALFWVLHQVRREEREIAMLETRLRIDEERLKTYEGVSEENRRNVL